MASSRPDALGVPRDVAWAPTDDPARRGSPSAFSNGPWTASGLTALGHRLSVDIASGALVVAATDLTMPYRQLPFQAVRVLDAAEQHAQQAYLDSHPNTDPRIHLFANWQSTQEATVSAVWHSVLPEVLVSEAGGGGLYYRSHPDFAMNTVDATRFGERLRAYGVPGRTLAALGFDYTRFDLLLRSRQGRFSALAGSYRGETLLDPAEVDLLRFDVLSGSARRYSSEFGYQGFIDGDGAREVTGQALVVDAVDALGHRVSFAPAEAQPPYRTYRLQDGSGRAIRFDLDDHVDYLDGNRPLGTVRGYVVTRVADETGGGDDITYSYSGGRLVTVSYPGHAGGPARDYRYDYDEDGHLVRITDPVGDWFAIEYAVDLYDTDERLMPRLKVSRLADADGNEARYAYDHAAHTVRVTFSGPDGESGTTTYRYIVDSADTRQRYLSEASIAVERGFSGSQLVETRWTYSTDGRFTIDAITDALGGQSTFAYDDYGQVTTSVDAAGHPRSFRYDCPASPSADTPNRYDLVEVSEPNVDAGGGSFVVSTQASFERYGAGTSSDAADAAQSTHRVVTRTDELGAVWRYDYDDAASHLPLQPTGVTDPLGSVTGSSFDATGLLLARTDAVGSTWTRTWNQRGQLVGLRDPNGAERTWSHDDGSGWLTAATDARGTVPDDPAHSVRYDYDAAGRRTRDTDPTGAVLSYSYLANRRLGALTRELPIPETTSFGYDSRGFLTQLRVPTGHSVFFAVDEAGRTYQTYRDDPARPSLQARFDAAGRAVAITDRNGRTTGYGYDAVGRVVSVSEPDWPADSPSQAGKQVVIVHDALGRPLRVSDSELARDRTYGYDAAGRLIGVTDPFGPSLSYRYDARGALVEIASADAVIGTSFARDAAGHVTRVTDSDWGDPGRDVDFGWQDGAKVDNLYRIDSDAGLSVRFGYDPNRQLTRVATEFAGTPVASFGYAYRADGLVGEATGSHASSYDYDGAKRLTAEGDAGVRSGYDGAGNRLWRASQPPPSGQDDSFDADDRLTRSGMDGTEYAYDDNGSLLRRTPVDGPATEYSYDGAGRLRQVRQADRLLSYTYDADGRLLERVAALSGSEQRTRFLYANGAIVAQLDDQDHVRVLHTRSDDGRLLRRRSADALVPAPSADPHSLWYVHDGLGSVVRLLDGDGHQQVRAAYDAWGGATVHGSAVGDWFGYRAGFRDPDSGLTSFGRRWYDPSLGRWLTQDPLLFQTLLSRQPVTSALAELANLYLYAAANPVNLGDPSGLGPPWDWFDWLRGTTPGKVLEKAMRGRKIQWPSGEPEPTIPEQVEKKAPPSNEDEQVEQPDPPEEFDLGAGEGSHSPSSERTYNDPEVYARAVQRQAAMPTHSVLGAIGIGAILVGAWEGVKWGVAVVAAPETGGASLGLAGAMP